MHIENSPISKKIINFPPIVAKCINFPYIHSNYVFLPNLHFFASPYFDHDAFMRHALHMLDSPAHFPVCSKFPAFDQINWWHNGDDDDNDSE